MAGVSAGALLLALGAGYLLGRSPAVSTKPSADAGQAGRRILYYRDPMGRADTSPVPKKDPMGMDYVPVYADQPGQQAQVPGAVSIDPVRLQTLGVRTEPVRRERQAMTIRASATLAVDESRQYAIAPRFDGWVERLYSNQTGQAVRAGQPLLAVYSPQVAATREEIRLADNAIQRLGGADPAGAAAMRRLRDAAMQRLRNWEISTAGSAGNTVLFRSPVSGFVLEKPVVQGARFAPGETILRVADLSRVWAVAHVPVAQAQGLATGRPARFESPTRPGEVAEGRITFIQPTVDSQSRTLDVRVEISNLSGEWRPGLFGNLTFDGPQVDALTVPEAAVIDSGERQVALVDLGGGRFAPREVAVGRRLGGRIEILSGLREGERVVTAANFLIDAESNLQSALQGLGAHNHGAPAATPAPAPSEPSAAPSGHEGH
ncbi:MAG: efflux RND transporter periplasmic adaptor subunit [Pseudomonadota bacterium]